MASIAELYAVRLEEEPYAGLFGVPHTMAEASLDRYVTATKFTHEQRDLLEQAIVEEWPIEVHGAYVNHLPLLLATLQMTEVARVVRESARQKRFNKHRPLFLHLKDKDQRDYLWICAFPSREYVQQVKALAYYSYCRRKVSENDHFSPSAGRIKAIHYPALEAALPEWTGLRKAIQSTIKSGDVAIIGHVEELSNYFTTFDVPRTSECKIGNDGYGEIWVHDLPDFNIRAVLIGITHCFWGSAAGIIAATVAEAQASEVFYVAKAGTLIAEAKIHSLISPQTYYTLEKPPTGSDSYWNWKRHDVESGLHKIAPELVNQIKAGAHLTVPTVVGETIRQHERYNSLRPATIDNEIGYIARSISAVNRSRPSSPATRFTCLHFLTDYLSVTRPADDTALGTKGHAFDLATSDQTAKQKVVLARDQAFERAAEIIVSYLKQLGASRAKLTEVATTSGPRSLESRKEFILSCHRALNSSKTFRTIVAGPFFLHPSWYFERKLGRNDYPDFDAALANRAMRRDALASGTRLIITNSERYPRKLLEYIKIEEIDRLVADCLRNTEIIWGAGHQYAPEICCANVGHTHIPYVFDDIALCQYRTDPLTPTEGGYAYENNSLVGIERHKFDRIFERRRASPDTELEALKTILKGLPSRIARIHEGRDVV